MSYCRFSSDDFRCDVYVYESVYGGFVTHVAANRIVGDIPRLGAYPTPSRKYDAGTKFKDMDDEDRKAVSSWNDRYQAQMDFVSNAERAQIELPYAGEQFDDDSLEELLARLTMLKNIGYNVPQFVFENIKDELEE